jgi:glycosyl transferase family 25
VTDPIFAKFDQVRIVNLVDRPDRRREMSAQIKRVGGFGDNVRFFEAHRPGEQGKFPSLGARGCFESQLTVIRSALESSAKSLCLLEDDLDFTRSGRASAASMVKQLFSTEWDLFYGAHLLPSNGRVGLVEIPSAEPVVTASFVGFNGRILRPLVEFLDAMLDRPAGSPEYGPMHVDGAYTVFRMLNPQFRTFAAFPALARQRSSPSDITPSGSLLDRHVSMRPLSRALRHGYNLLKRL